MLDGQFPHRTNLYAADPRRRDYLERARGMTRTQMPVLQLLEAQDSPTMVIEDVAHHWEAHSAAARAIAEEHLDACKVLPRMVEASG